MRRILALSLCLLAGCSTIATEGPPGPPGEDGAPGPAGADGVPGAHGLDAVLSGARLRARFIVGEDGARIATGDFDDGERHEVCRFRELEGETRCTPPWGEGAGGGFSSWAASDCTGTVARGPLYGGAPCAHWSTGVRYCVDRLSPVPEIYYIDPSDGVCKPWTETIEDWFLWPEVELDDFVLGIVTPE